ncbi:hypothetical protein WEB32_00280 [Streptomyces netropsis]|uniref:hypothetical protein n=1 Tax=Streptomyces netropsis TaxID=55404 RepID=UPI0030CD3BF1
MVIDPSMTERRAHAILGSVTLTTSTFDTRPSYTTTELTFALAASPMWLLNTEATVADIHAAIRDELRLTCRHAQDAFVSLAVDSPDIAYRRLNQANAIVAFLGADTLQPGVQR